MENYLTCSGKRFVVFLNCLFWLLLSNNLNAQNPLTITWDKESGCQIYKEDERKEFLEDIGSGVCVRVCENSDVIYSLSNPDGYPATWTITGGTIDGTPTDTTCPVVWGEAGWGNVAVTAQTPDGPQTREVCIEIIDGPLAQFYVEPYDPDDNTIGICLDETVYFTNTSHANGGTELVSYLWNFRNKPQGINDYSSEFAPSYTFTTPGTYVVTLTVTNQCNCTSTYTMRVAVSRETGFDITCNSVVCEGGTDTYTIPEEIAARCNEQGVTGWSVQGGTIISPQPYGGTIEVLWDNVDDSGFGYVTFDARDCGIRCALTTIKVPVVKNEGTIIGETVVCSEEYIRYKLPQWPTTDFNWVLEDPNGTYSELINTDQRNEVIIFTQHEGTIKLRCTYQNTLLNCGGTAELEINIKPLAQISGPDALCVGDYEQFIIGGYDADWILNTPDNQAIPFSGGVFFHTFTVPGKYTLTATGDDFCSEKVPFSIRVDAIPETPDPADITGPVKVCPDMPNEYSMVNDVPGTILVWSATNGIFSGSNYGEEVTVTFTGPGPYDISVRRENTAEPHCISPPATLGVAPHEVVLDIEGNDEDICASSVEPYWVAYNEGEVYEWTIDPPAAGSVMSGQNTNSIEVLWNNNLYPNTKVVLRVRKCNVFTDPVELPVDVMLSPEITINGVPDSVCPGESFTMTLSSNPPLTSGTIRWDMGTGALPFETPFDQTSLTFDYGDVTANAGFTISVTVVGANGCLNPSVANENITVRAVPVAVITPSADQVFCGGVVPFDLVATLMSGYNTDIQWYKDGVLLLGETNWNYTVTAPGTYQAWIENEDGCGTWTEEVEIFEGCITGCTPVNMPTITLNGQLDDCNTVTVTANAVPAPIGPANWYIGNEGDILPGSTNTSASFDYEAAGNHIIIYEGPYPAVGGGICYVRTYTSVVVPYIPKVEYTIECSATPGMYDVTILDESSYYPLTPPSDKNYIVDGVDQNVSGMPGSYTVPLGPGNHQIGIELLGVYPCSAFETVELPAIASAEFSAPAQICQQEVALLVPVSLGLPNVTYEWDFGDGTTNLMPLAAKVYNSPGFKTITLTVTDQFGCIRVHQVTIEVMENRLAGALQTDSPNCEGDPITITFVPDPGSDAPTQFTWMKDEIVLATNTSSTLTVNESGGYWVSLSNDYSCHKHLDAVPAKFIMTPDPVVEGPDGACVGEEFTLSGYAGQGMQYMWYYNGSPYTGWSSSPGLTTTLWWAGTHNFMVKVKIDDGNGGSCEASSELFEIDAYDIPGEPAAWFDFVQCDNPYKFKLHADAGQPGTYTWSNGMSGADIEVTSGGPYLVTFTNEGGCTSTAQIDVPKDPESYFWIFPKGCYDFCNKTRNTGPFTIIGPSQSVSFPYWSWLLNGNVMLDGSNSAVQDYSPMYSGIYNMTLDNGYCHKTTEPMELTIQECDCEVKWEIREIHRETRPYCFYKVIIFIDNPSGDPIYANIYAPNGTGVFTPGNVTVPPGGDFFTFIFTPTNFSGGPLEIGVRATVDRKECRLVQEIDFPNCYGENARMAMEGDGDLYNRLVVAPNPAKGSTGLTYTFANPEAQERTIEIYTLMGVLLDTHKPENNQGVWTVNLQRYPAGQYIAVMRENGLPVAQQAIVVE